MELASQNQLPAGFGQLSKNADIFMRFAAMAILMVMLIPIPAFFLDLFLFLTLNITSTTDPRLAQKIINQVAVKLERFAQVSLQPIILCSAMIRPHFKKLVDRFIPNLVILSYEEIANTAKINNLGTVELPDAD